MIAERYDERCIVSTDPRLCVEATGGVVRPPSRLHRGVDRRPRRLLAWETLACIEHAL